MCRVSLRAIFLSSFMALASTLLLFSTVQAGGSLPLVGHVYVLTNPDSENAIAVFSRFSDGSLALVGTTPIGGQGTGVGLGSQGSLNLSPDQHWLFAVDAGSNQISVVAVNNGHLNPRSPTDSGGVDPVSLTYSHGYLYVLNAGNQNNSASVTGFQVENNGTLTPPLTKQPLSTANPGPAEVHASPDGNYLIVTEKTTNRIDSYKINHDGSLSAPSFTPSTGTTPFGFAFNPVNPQNFFGHGPFSFFSQLGSFFQSASDQFVVSDAFGGNPGAGALTSYQVQGSSQVSALDGPVPDNQTAPCWVVIRNDGKFAYTTNAHSNSISIYGVNSGNGKLSFDLTVNLTSETAPTEMSLSPDSNFLYGLDATGSHGNVSAFRVNSNGSLSAPLDIASSSLPTSVIGIAVD
jgi:6-phosphogluconolactonase